MELRATSTRTVGVESVIIALRWVGLLFAIVQTATYYLPFPPAVMPWAIGILAGYAVAAIGLTAWWWCGSGTSTPFIVAAVVVDVLFTVGVTWVYAFDVNTAIFVVVYLPPLEAALRWGMRGSMAVAAVVTIGYAAREWWAHLEYGHDLLVTSVSFRMGVGVLIAAIGGAMADRYRREHRRVVEALDLEREAAGALRSLDELRSTFLSAVSHELRTPLTSILGFALTMRDHARELTPATTAMLDHVVGESRRLELLLEDLLDVERMGRGLVSLERSLVDMDELLEKVAARFAGRIEPVRPTGIEAAIDGPKVERIIDNLLSNGMKYAPPGSALRVRVLTVYGGIEIIVEDCGPGVPEELRESIFAPFERGHLTSTHQPGTGIGLTIVDRFARLHGGRAWVDDRLDTRGAAFHVYLPDGPVGTTAHTFQDG